jgi:hypothetical protein
MIATVSAVRSTRKDQLLMGARTATAQLRVPYLGYREGDRLLFPKLFSVSLDLVHALA